METYRSFMIEFDREPKKFMEESIFSAVRRHNTEKRDTSIIPEIPLTPQAIRLISEITKSYLERKTA